MALARTVRVYQGAIRRLVDDPHDPLSQDMDHLAEQIRVQALANARVIIPQLPDSFLQVEAGKDTKGMFFRVSTDGGGHWASYLSGKEAREHNWFAPAVESVVGTGGTRSLVGGLRGVFPRGAGFTI